MPQRVRLFSIGGAVGEWCGIGLKSGQLGRSVSLLVVCAVVVDLCVSAVPFG